MLTRDEFERSGRGAPNVRFALESGRRVIVACGCGDRVCEGWALVTPSEAAGWSVEVGRVTDWSAYDRAEKQNGFPRKAI